MNKPNTSQVFLNTMIALIAYIGMSSSALAHTGHDHAANESMLVHALFYGSIIGAIALLGWVVYRQFNKQNTK